MELHCGKCKVRSWHPGDVESLVKHANNQKVWITLRDRFPHPYTRTDAQNWIQGSLTETPETNFAIDLFEKAVGGISFQLKTDVERYSAEVGYWLGEEFWGQGICTSALKGATKFAFETYPLNRIFAVPFSENLASRRVLEKAGYHKEGMMRLSAFKDGRFVDEVLYAFVIENWTPSDRK